ncbi:T9SS type A sorting domain-containing protein [Ancylomarina salipaludis]|uniref:T9SS type A sorting domain-containing protein n=1 Tax=Ancylomarina salipaludis TaxID=2501299 RepID=A0A4Q1JPD7_9BACT|nr:cadherin-like domain-containing protein [Ancylomarina salipaludis]RXQ96090.1 T9SS type A sorting domain-containing protein [Ancylomarina salipaludis]
MKVLSLQHLVLGITKNILAIAFLFAGSLSFGQTTENYDAAGTANNQVLANGFAAFDYGGFTYQIISFNGTNSSLLDILNWETYGNNGTDAIGVSGAINDKITVFKLTKTDGSAFSTSSLWMTSAGDSYTITGYNDGNTTGQSVSVSASFSGIKTLNFTGVDELRFEGTEIIVDLDDFTYTLGAANAAPTATAPSAPTVSEDDTNVALSDDIQVADTDGDNQTVTFTITGGTLTIGTTGITFGGSGNGNASFTAAGTLAAISTALDAATFTPTPNLSGTNAGTIAFISNDGTDNSNTASVSFDITAVNDPPRISTNSSLSLNEGATGTITSASHLSATDVDNDDSGLIFTITTNTSNGAVKRSGTILNLNETFTQADLVAGIITYTHDDSNTTSDSFVFKVSDGSAELTNQTFSISVTAIDDDTPTISTNNGLTLNEGATKVITTTELEADDADTDNTTLTYTVTAAPSNGQLENTDNAGNPISSFTQQHLIDGKIQYVHDDGNTTSDSFTFKVADGTPNELTGQTFNITVTPVDDDAPTIATNNGLALNEGATKAITTTELEANDADTDNTTLTYTVTAAPSNGQLENTDNAGNPISSFTQQHLIDGKIQYVHDDGNTTSDSFTFKVADGTPNELTGQTFNITVTPVDDDAPTIATNNGLALNEGATKAITTTELEANDADTDNTTLTYTVTAAPSNGQLENTDNAGNPISSFTQQHLIDGKIQYVHDGSNTTSDSFTFKVADGTPNELTGQTFNITVTPVDDDTPTISTNNGLTLNEGATKGITTTELVANDTDTNNTTLTFTVTSAPSNGQLENTDNAGNSISSFTQQHLIDGKIQYVHDDGNTTSDSFTFKVADGTPNELTGQTFNITVTPVDDDAPTIATNSGLALNEGATKAITTTELEANDPDTDNTTLTYTVTAAPSNGQLENMDAVGVEISSFTQQHLVDGKIQYVHDGSNTTSDSFTFKVADGTPNELTDQTFNITVNDVTPPSLTSSSPADDVANATLSGNIVLNFDDGMVAGTGNITIKKMADNSIFEQIPIGDAKINISSSQITINPAGTLEKGTGYYIEIDGTALDDDGGNSFAGISGNSTLNFTTVDVVINEVVTDPQQDWSSTSFASAPGGTSGSNDEWVELYINSTGIDLTEWTIELLDGSDITGNLTNTGAFAVSNYIGGGSFANTMAGDYLVLGNPAGAGLLNNSITINLKDSGGAIVDVVVLGGGSGEAPDGGSTGIYDESVQRYTNGLDTDVDSNDFTKGIATIGATNSGPSVTLSVSSTTVAEAAEVSTITATLSEASNQITTVSLAVNGSSTASAGDYSLSSTSIVISAGSITGTATITATQDVIDENNETVIIDVTGVTNGTEAGTQQQTVTITDDDEAPTVAFNATSSNGVESLSSADLQVDLSAVSGLNVSVDYAVTGTATGSGTDYTLANGTLTISAGSASDNITIASIINDLLDENNETVIVTLSNPSNATLGTNTVHTYTISDDDAKPTIAFNLTSSNGDETVSSANLQVDLSAASGRDVTVDYTVTGTATGSGNDYTLANGTLTITAGSANDNITIVNIVNDLLDENNETVIVTLSNPVNATLGSNTVHTYTINDDDATPTIAFNSTSSNGAESVSSKDLQVDISAVSGLNVSVDYAVTGTATGGGTDYTLANGTLTIGAGNASNNITIGSIVDDLLDENNETVIVTLSNPSNATLGSNSVHTYTITDNDATPTVAFNSTSSNGLESVSSADLQVDLLAVSGLTVTVDYEVIGTASGSGTDYTLADGTLTIAAGGTSENITIGSIVDDLLDENNETVIVTLSNPTNTTLGTNTVHTYTITDNDATPTVAFNSISSDGLESVSSADLQVDLSAASGLTVIVDYVVTGTANGGGTDYTLADGTLTIAAGDVSDNITIGSIVDDLLDENNETVIVTLSNPTNATLGSNTVHTYTIMDNDATPTIAFNTTSSNGLESVSNADLQVDLSAASGLVVTVDYVVTGTAIGADYTLEDGTLTIAAGDVSDNITIGSIVDDLLDENNETVIVTLSNPTNATLGSNTVHTYTITDNDATPTVAFTSVSSNGLESISSADLQVDLSVASGLTVTVDYEVTGTATGADYTLVAGTLTISAGDTSENITISGIVDDLLDENNETVIVTLSNPMNATLGSNTVHTYTITDNDATPTVAFNSTSSSGLESVSSSDLQVDLSAASGLTVTVDYEVTGTANGGGTDYTLADGTLTIAAGDASENITISGIVDDLSIENNETVIVTLSNPTNATLGSNIVHSYTITDNDTPPEIAFNLASSAGSESIGSADLQVDLSVAFGLTITVDYTVTGTASGSGVDYILTDGTLTIAAGDASDNITISGIVDDLLDESNETVIVTLSNPTNATLGSNTVHTYTIMDNDATPTVAFNSTSSNGLESVSSADLQVDLSAASGLTVTVDYEVTGMASGSGTDYTLADGTLTIAAGGTSENITIGSIVDDLLDENNETVIVTLSNPTNATLGSNTVHTYTITDNDATPTVAFNSISSNGLESVSSADLQVDLSAASGLTVTVDYELTGTATGADYTLVAGTLTISAGDTSDNITIGSIVEDLLDENNETVIVTLSNPTNATLGSNTVHTYTITDNDVMPTVRFNSISSNGLESVSSADLQVDLSAASGLTVTVDYTVTGTASGSGTDYTLADGTLTIAAGDVSDNITIGSIVDDLLDENNETVIVTLSNPMNATLGTNMVHTYTINDNDSAPSIAFNTVSSNGLESVSSADLQVDLSAASGLIVTVDYAVTGTATGSGTDYTLANGTLTIAAGDASNTITISSIVDDLLDENNETVIVSLSNPVNAILGTNTVHTYTITDNDETPVIVSNQSFSVNEDALNDVSLGTVLATDSDAGTIFSNWTITSGNDDAIFAIDPVSGVITVKDNSNLDFETQTSYSLEVAVSDGTNISVPEAITVNVNNINDNTPVVISDQNYSIDEDIANHTNFVTVLASDADSGTIFTEWAILSGNSDGIFVINSATGQLGIADNAMIDFENQKNYHLGICVSDGLYTSTAEEVVITIRDVNERPVAIAGENQIVPNNSKVTLDAWNSYDPDGDYLDFVWTAPDGIELSDIHDPKPIFMSPNVLVSTDFVFKLVVNDGKLYSEESSVVVTVDNVTGIEDIDADQVNIFLYPNPSKGAFYIELNKRPINDATVGLINLSGKLVYSQKLYEKKTYLNLSLKSGMYFLKVELDNRIVMKKIIID